MAETSVSRASTLAATAQQQGLDRTLRVAALAAVHPGPGADYGARVSALAAGVPLQGAARVGRMSMLVVARSTYVPPDGVSRLAALATVVPASGDLRLDRLSALVVAVPVATLPPPPVLPGAGGVLPARNAEMIEAEWLQQLLPSGQAWAYATQPGSNLAGLIRAAALSRASLETFLSSLQYEICPGTSQLLLADYQAVLGPDPAKRDLSPLSTVQMQALLQQRWIGGGGQSISYYQRLAASYGVNITIEEPEPAICGMCVCGDAVCAEVTIRFVWIVQMDQDNVGLRAAIAINAPADTAVYFQVQGNWVS